MVLLGARSRPALGQGAVTVVPNEALFSMLAAINLAGYDTGLDSEPATGLRHEARVWCAKRVPEVVPALTHFYRDHQLSDPSADLGQYLSLALLLGPPPDFNPTVADTDLPPDGAAVKEIVPLLQRFYREAGLQELWSRLQPAYESTINDWSGPIRQSITNTDAYLRSPSGAYLGRTYTINIGLLAAPGQVQARIYGENYYLVATSSEDPPIADVRHQYLHFLLDPLALKYAFEVHQKESLAALARPAPALGSDFKEDFPLLLTECLIRAVELRMDKPPQPEKQVDQMTKEGLILVPYFYEALGDFGNQPAAMGTYYRQMVLDIAIPKERQRLASVKFSPPAEVKMASHPVVRRTAADALLDQGDNLIFQGNYAEAKTVFSNVLGADARNERALFGMAVVASNTRKPDTAEDYFKKTLEVARSSRIAAWSHIYLGRIYDLEGNRKQALAQYHAASLAAGASQTRGARCKRDWLSPLARSRKEATKLAATAVCIWTGMLPALRRTSARPELTRHSGVSGRRASVLARQTNKAGISFRINDLDNTTHERYKGYDNCYVLSRIPRFSVGPAAAVRR
jgi:tetratricopeptide (TPR) repeat protein